MTSSRRTTLLATAAVTLAAIGGAIAFSARGGTSASASATFAKRAGAICQTARREGAALSGEKPAGLPQALELDHELLGVFARETAALGSLQPPSAVAAPFAIGVADSRQLLAGLRSMLARPDFVQLSITLPGHPQLEPQWLKAWLAREHALVADAQARFASVGVPACGRLSA